MRLALASPAVTHPPSRAGSEPPHPSPPRPQLQPVGPSSVPAVPAASPRHALGTALFVVNQAPALAAESAPTGRLPRAIPSRTDVITPLPPQGIFTSCDVAASLSACEARLPVITGAGLKLVVEGLPPLGPALLQYLAALKADGLQAVWEMIDPGWWGYDGAGPLAYDPAGQNMLAADPSWASACGCETNTALLAFIARTLTASGATYGWYLADDSQLEGTQPYPLSEALAGIRRFSSDLHAAAPGTRTLLGAWGLDDTTLLQQASGTTDMAAQEMYPFASYGSVPVADSDALSQVARGARSVQRIADADATASAFVLQAFSWGECSADAAASGADPGSPYPSAAEMSGMRDSVLANARPALILWYTLEETIGWPAGQEPAGCAAPADPAARLAALTAAVKAPYPPVAGR